MSAAAEEQNSHSRIFQSEAVTRRSTRRLSRIAKVFDPLFKRARADSQRWRPHRALSRGQASRAQASRASIREYRQVNIETSEPTLQPGMAERAIDTATDVSRTITEVSAGLQAAVSRLSEAVATARQPGKPLSTISAITREAPLASLFVAFLFGIAVARRR
jgi:hypothetical protein